MSAAKVPVNVPPSTLTVVALPLCRLRALPDVHLTPEVHELLRDHLSWLPGRDSAVDSDSSSIRVQTAVYVMTQVERQAFFIFQDLHKHLVSPTILAPPPYSSCSASGGNDDEKAAFDATTPPLEVLRVLRVRQLRYFNQENQKYPVGRPIFSAFTVALHMHAYDYVARIVSIWGSTGVQMQACLHKLTQLAHYAFLTNFNVDNSRLMPYCPGEPTDGIDVDSVLHLAIDPTRRICGWVWTWKEMPAGARMMGIRATVQRFLHSRGSAPRSSLLLLPPPPPPGTYVGSSSPAQRSSSVAHVLVRGVMAWAISEQQTGLTVLEPIGPMPHWLAAAGFVPKQRTVVAASSNRSRIITDMCIQLS